MIRELGDKAFGVVLALVLLLVVGRAGVAGIAMPSEFAGYGNDDVMRLVSVRNWLGGQGWFDMVEHRMMPPDGIQMHWSRYLDAAIAGFVTVLSWFMQPSLAEMWAVTLWPTVLMVAMILLVGFAARRFFGPAPACFSILCLALWPMTFDLYFSAGRIDHHNVQVLMMVLMVIGILQRDRPVLGGILSGSAAGFALAVGLESLPFIVVMGCLLLVRSCFVATNEARPMLQVFTMTLAATAGLFWLGQTASDRLLLPVCDQLGTPVLSLIAIALVAISISTVLPLQSPWMRLAGSVAAAVGGCVLAWPLLGPCLAGPYAQLPQEVQEIISGYIVEALPAIVFATERPLQLNAMMTPVIGSICLAAYFWKSETGQQRDTIGQLLVLSLIGILASLSQIRLLVMTAATVPFLAGYALSRCLAVYTATRSGGAAVLLFGASILILAPFLANEPMRNLLRAPSGAPGSIDGNCRDYRAMSTLNEIPPAIILTPMNLGPLMLWSTHHRGLSGSYHRSPQAFANGLLPFLLPEDEMRMYLEATNASHLMLCAGSNYGAGFASKLSAGAEANWLTPIPLEAGDILLFQIDPVAEG